jgi:hypothetical protein
VQVLSPVADAVTLPFTEPPGLTLSVIYILPDTVNKEEADTDLLMRPVKDGRAEADTDEEALLVFVLV